MRFNTLKAENFGPFKELDLDLSGETVSVFVGPNWSGKTSILNAIRALVAGTIPGVMSKDSRLLAGPAGDSWRIEAVATNASGQTGRIARTPTTLKGFKGSGEAVEINETKLRAVLGADPEALDAVLDLSKVFGLAPDERRTLALRLAGVRPTVVWLKERGIDDGEIAGLCVAGNWSKAERTATERKRALGRAAKEMVGTKPVAPTVRLSGKDRPADSVTPEELAKMQSTLKGLENEEKRLIEAKGKIGGGIEAILAEIAEKERLRAGIDTEHASRDLGEAEKEIGVAEQHLDTLDGRIGEAQADYTQHGSALSALAKQIASMKEANRQHPCPICGFVHAAAKTCTQDALAAAEKTKEELAAKVRAAEQNLAILRTEAKALTETLGQIRGAATSAQARLGEASRLDAEIARLRGKSLKIGQAAKGDQPDAAQIDADLEKVASWLANGRATVGAVMGHMQAVRAWEKAEQGATKLREDAARFEAMETALRPGGLQAELVQPVMEKARGFMARWVEALLPMGVVLEDSGEILVPGRPLAVLSGSERWAVGLALAASMAQLSGLRFLAIDEAAVLDEGNKGRLGKLLIAVAKSGEFDQVLVAMPLGARAPRQMPAESGVRVYLTGEGGVRPVVGAEVQAVAAD